MDIFTILNVLFYLSLSIILFDLDYRRTKLPEEPETPKWVGIIYWIGIITWLWILFINWKIAIIGIIVYYLSVIIPLPQTIGNILMSPFKSKINKK